MQRADLLYSFPDDLIATRPLADFRTVYKAWNLPPKEILFPDIFQLFRPGDALVINDTLVEPRRIFSVGPMDSESSADHQSVEIVFVQPIHADQKQWEVLFPARSLSQGETLTLPDGIIMTLHRKSLPQIVHLNRPLDSEYFKAFGEPALPPYIQRARGQRHALPQDYDWYQTSWAQKSGSVAAPTASLHFRQEHLHQWQTQGIKIIPITLEVGLGTFLPIKTERLQDHRMHEEKAKIPSSSLHQLKITLEQGNRVWALGTTVVRCLESWASGLLTLDHEGHASGSTQLFIRPGYEFKIVSGLLTNFHQPGSTLLALVAAFAGRDEVLQTYNWAIARHFRLFSYGDLSIWTRQPTLRSLRCP